MRNKQAPKNSVAVRQYAKAIDGIYNGTTPDGVYDFKMTFRARVSRFGSYEAACAAAIQAATASIPGADISPGILERYHGRKVCRITAKGVATRRIMLDAFAEAVRLSTGEDPRR